MKKWIALLLVLALTAPAAAAWAEADAPAITPYAYFAVETLPKIQIETEEGMALDDPSLVIPGKYKGFGNIPEYDYVNAAITVTDCEGYELDHAAGAVKIRGNFTANYPKKPIRIKFDEKQPMCGLNGGAALKSWVLLAEYNDASLLRNSAALYIANSLYSTTGNYASDFRNVEVYLNGQFNGVYVLCEQQQVNKARVNLPQPENPKKYDLDALTEEEAAALRDGRTGYLIEFDGYYVNEDPSVTFTIRYDWVTRPNGQTFLASSEGNDPMETDQNAPGGGENNGASAGVPGNGGNNGAFPGVPGNGGNGGASAGGPANGGNGGASPGVPGNGGNNGQVPGNGNNGGAGQGNNGWGGGFGWGGFGGFGRGGNGTTRQTGFTIKSDFYYEEQRAFIQRTMQTVWDVLYDAVYTDHSDLAAHPYYTMDGDGNRVAAPGFTTAYEAIASVVDVDSLVDMFILQEICQDTDLGWSSFYFSIDMSPDGNHLLTYTAPWDFDNGFGQMQDNTTLFVLNADNPWLAMFWGEDWFWQRVNARFDEAAAAGVFTGVLEMLDTVTRVNAEAYERNRERWAQTGGASGGGSGGRQSQAQAEQTLHSWLETKLRNLDRLINEMAGE